MVLLINQIQLYISYVTLFNFDVLLFLESVECLF